MSDTRQAWEQVGDHLSGLGQKMKHHLEQELSDDDGEQVVSALKKLGDAIEETVEAIGNAAKDPAVKEDVKNFGRSFVAALSVTAEDASGRVRDVVDRQKAGPGESSGAPPPSTAEAEGDDGPTPPRTADDDGPGADDGLSDD